MITLRFEDLHVAVLPEIGGSISRFDWCGEPILRTASQPTVLDAACFPMVPYCNRIAHGRFAALGDHARLPVNVPVVDPDHPMHGHGWLAVWDVIAGDATSVTVAFEHDGRDWPWRYRAVQRVELGTAGLTLTLSVINPGSSAMPTGLGFHPYFPRDAETLYHGLHSGEWQAGSDRLPECLDRRAEPIDWWDGRPVASRLIDTVYTGRSGAMTIAWPNRDIGVTLTPDDALTNTAVFVPPGQTFFCIEPATQMTNALNWPDDVSGTVWLAPGRTLSVALTITPHRLRRKDAFP